MEVRNRLQGAIEFLAVGHLAVDYREGQRALGGAAAYSALTASRLGLRSAMVTAVGEDFDLFSSLEGVEVWFHRKGASTAFENVYVDGHRRQRLLGRARPLTAEDLGPLESRLAEDAIVFYCPLARELEIPLVPLAPRGLCGVAPQGFFRQWDSEGRVSPAPWPEAPDRLGRVDLLTLSEDDPPDLDGFLRQVSGKVRVLAVTAGTRPVDLYSEGRRFHIPVLARPEVDPTGAGDVFGAALLVGLRAGRDSVEATRLACCAASFAVERPGVDGVPPGREAVEARLAEYRKLFATKDSALEEYCSQIESFFFQLKGRPGDLSPADFARVKRWFAEGVPLQDALDGIAAAFRAVRAGRNREVEEVNGLAFCERFIEQARR